MSVAPGKEIHNRAETGSNRLLPVFIRLDHLRLVLIGGDTAAYEQLQAILAEAPAAGIKITAPRIIPELEVFASYYTNVSLIRKSYSPGDLFDADLAIITERDQALTEQVRNDARARRVMVYTPYYSFLCDFYTASPSGEKITTVTNTVVNSTSLQAEKKWQRIASRFLFAFFFMFIGHLILSYIPFNRLLADGTAFFSTLDSTFYWMILAGFLAQLVDGMLGMGYGVVSATVLLSLGVKLPAISGSIHTAEMFSSAASGYSHYRFGNVNRKLFKALLIPGVLGAVAGAVLLSVYGDRYAMYIRPLLACYTLLLGIRILRTGFRGTKQPRKVKRAGWLAAAGGFLDSFGGGGWGPLVTSTLIAKGKTPRYVIGSVSITEFFVTLASAATFFSMLGISHWPVIAGLIIGGMIAAPLAAALAGKLPLKTMFLGVGILVIAWSIRILIQAFL
ncbi:TSUP family transporter [Sediminibacterium ginsengisoli]|uniref:Probable membrane transporter protein n=1 Tax=Sediminibacterium ginsengisoli TaxID=413434 RepID=A0A1T4M9P5_9BACT|nr:TSUP family transporter [Sediminibacterium ginsengisoli]SJZ63652.1 Uncharacterized membrane protein YfcA [Sediminibacterium ginsengisoli]